jgi:hypothetical protein
MSEIQAHRLDAVKTYLVLMPLVAIGAVLVEGACIEFANLVLPRGFGGNAFGWALNVVPGAAVGFFTFRRPAREAAELDPRPVVGHLMRATPLYLVVIVGTIALVIGTRSGALALVGQLLLWPVVAWFGALVADVVALQRRPLAPRNAAQA